MSTVYVIYDSLTGFTEKIAKTVIEGACMVKNVDVTLLKIGTPFSVSILNVADAIVLGSPVIYGDLTFKIKDFLESVRENVESNHLRLAGKIGGVFGSYSFSGGWVIRELGTIIEDLGIKLVTPPLPIVDGMGKNMPIQLDQPDWQKCHDLGKIIAETVTKAY